MQERRPGGSGAVLLGRERPCLTKISLPRPQQDDLTKLRALHLVQTFGLRPELAVMIAAVAFGGGQ